MAGTHPPQAYCPQLTNLNDIKSTLESRLFRDDRRNASLRYGRVIVLTFCWCWDESSQGGSAANWAQRLGETFAREYQCEVRPTILGAFPSEGPEYIMSQALRKAARDLGPNDLLIVYYAGHSVLDGNDLRDRDIFLKPSCPPVVNYWGPEGPAVSFAHLQTQPRLDNPRARVLWLLDCSHDGSEALVDNHEIIAASEFESVAPNPGNRRHFTSHLIHELLVAASIGMEVTATQLYCLLANQVYTLDRYGNAVLPSFPIHTQHGNNTRPSIRLIPSSYQKHFLMGRIGSPSLQPAAVVLSARLSTGPATDWNSFRQWLGGHASHGIELVHDFSRLNDVAFFKVTFEVWCSLRGVPGLEFVTIDRHHGITPRPWEIIRERPATGSYDRRGVFIPFRHAPSSSCE
ncbi:hypothetical protein CkaCkLH20_02926 [Colletotrichum karsti]|uniref:Caspase domain-containing protein n=1 Tax=Colletotrichum karsti TaxID=1095194 RepID=A0A9P6I8Z6_9PEZI|nr:uncharacterized protein CkaCkLH20_02926 [Colletotrichum karsti]KAF9879383.1 hypothetical protein CkaCkLH20_02926 [Colletotrichum karsti]